MTLSSVHSAEQAIAQLIALAEGLQPGHPTQAHFTLYIVVRISGYLEKAVPEIYYAAARSHNKDQLTRFVGRRVKRRLWNPNAANLCSLAGDFDSSWEVELREFLEDDGRKDAINGIVDKRHKIAHGETVNVGLWQVKDWYKRILQYVRFIESQTAV